MLDSAEPRNNFLLAALPDPEWARWQPLLERVDMPLGQVLYESGATLTHVYFPTTAIVSLPGTASSTSHYGRARRPRTLFRHGVAPSDRTDRGLVTAHKFTG